MILSYTLIHLVQNQELVYCTIVSVSGYTLTQSLIRNADCEMNTVHLQEVELLMLV